MTKLGTGTLILAIVTSSAEMVAQTCGSALLVEKAAPAVFQGITTGGSTLGRYWEAGNGSQNFNLNGCAVGCKGFSVSALCAGGGSCIALSGVNWLNGSTCASAGAKPARTVFVVESTTALSGGLWAAFNLDKDGSDSNYDLDARATSACGSACASTASAYIGGAGQPITINSAQLVGGNLVVSLSWLPSPAAAEALNNSGASVVKSYSVFYTRATGGTPPPNTGSKTGWTRVDDTDAARIAGYSTDTNAIVSINPQGSMENVYLAIGLNFDGTGNPATDPNTKESLYVSSQSAAIPVPNCVGETVAPSVTAPIPVTVRQTICQ